VQAALDISNIRPLKVNLQCSPHHVLHTSSSVSLRHKILVAVPAVYAPPPSSSNLKWLKDQKRWNCWLPMKFGEYGGWCNTSTLNPESVVWLVRLYEVGCWHTVILQIMWFQFIQFFSVHTWHVTWVKSSCHCRKWLICVRFVHLSHHMEKLSSFWTYFH